MRTVLLVTVGLLVGARAATANTVCRSNGWMSAAPDELAPVIPAGCPLELYVPLADAAAQPTAAIGDVAVAVSTRAAGSQLQPRIMNQCSTIDASCWQWNTFDVELRVIEVVPASPFPEGATVRIGDGTIDRLAVRIGAAAACPPRRVLREEMCADPLGGPCTGGAFTCANGDGGLGDGGLGDGGPGDGGPVSTVDGAPDGASVQPEPSAGGGCTTAGGHAGVGMILATLLGLRRRRR